MASTSQAAACSGISARWLVCKEVVPGRIYISAMPTYRGLQLAQERYHFRTIINLYPEYTPEQSPHWPDELRFARERGLDLPG